jgi:type II secretory pathway pseudopilin PulG
MKIFRHWFTLIELLAVILMIAVGLVAVLEWIGSSIDIVQKTKIEVQLINLTREWVEAVYQIRNTNRLRYSGDRDRCWLNSSPQTCNTNNSWISGSEMMRLIPSDLGRSLESVEDDGEAVPHDDDTTEYNLCMIDQIRQPCTDPSNISRSVQIQWLYDKRTGEEITTCNTGDSTYNVSTGNYDCSSSRPKELVFCVRTVSTEWQGGDVTLCGAITNFEQ